MTHIDNYGNVDITGDTYIDTENVKLTVHRLCPKPYKSEYYSMKYNESAYHYYINTMKPTMFQ